MKPFWWLQVEQVVVRDDETLTPAKPATVMTQAAALEVDLDRMSLAHIQLVSRGFRLAR